MEKSLKGMWQHEVLRQEILRLHLCDLWPDLKEWNFLKEKTYLETLHLHQLYILKTITQYFLTYKDTDQLSHKIKTTISCNLVSGDAHWENTVTASLNGSSLKPWTSRKTRATCASVRTSSLIKNFWYKQA